MGDYQDLKQGIVLFCACEKERCGKCGSLAVTLPKAYPMTLLLGDCPLKKGWAAYEFKRVLKTT
jgi:hypothetical protein